MSKPSPFDPQFWAVVREIEKHLTADISETELCKFQVVAVVYPGKPLPNHTKGGKVDVALDLDPSCGDLSKLTG